MVRLRAAVFDEDLRTLLRRTFPALRVARLLQPPTSGATLLTTLGLPRPVDEFTTACGSR